MNNIAVLLSVYINTTLNDFMACITSIRSQDLKDVGIRIYLCIDGNILPELNDFISENRYAFKAIITNKTNLGLAQSLNRLLHVLNGEDYVARMDTDDRMHESRLRIQVDFLKSHPELSACGSFILEEYDDGTIAVKSSRTTNKEIQRSFQYKSSVAHPTVMFRGEVFYCGQVYYPNNYIGCEDLGMWILFLFSGYKVGIINQPLVTMRIDFGMMNRRGRLRAILDEAILFFKYSFLTGITPFAFLNFVRIFFRLLPRRLQYRFYRSRYRTSIFGKL